MRKEQEEMLIEALSYMRWKVNRVENIVFALAAAVLMLLLAVLWLLTLPLNL